MTPDDSTPAPQPGPEPVTQGDVVLPSGRRVTIDGARESIEVRAPDGAIELQITLTPDGPALTMRAASLDIAAADAVRLQCKEFELRTEADIRFAAGGDVDIQGQGELRTKVSGDTYLDADYLKFNCRDRTGYHDEGVEDADVDAAGGD